MEIAVKTLEDLGSVRGQRVLVRVEKLDDVFVLPADAVARDGPDAYVFRRSGDAFESSSANDAAQVTASIPSRAKRD